MRDCAGRNGEMEKMLGKNKRWMAVAVLAGWMASGAAQQAATTGPAAVAGDQPDNPGALATDVSGAAHSKTIRAAMRKVADWELERVQAQPMSRSWDFGTLDIGFAAASRTLGDGKYAKYVSAVGDHFNWRLEHTAYPANDFAIAQAYLDAYHSSGEAQTVLPLRRRLDSDLQDPVDPARPLWFWCDALFMEPPAAAELSVVTGDPTYVELVNREWDRTRRQLYDREKHLYSRDASYLNKREKNGEKVFWSRGNGWAMAGLVRVLASLPSDDPLRPFYVQQLREMAAEIASLQGKDGLWRPGLLDAASYTEPEVSGSAFFTYALAWGISHHVLDAHVYLPVAELAWQGLVAHIYQDGRLGDIQPIGEAPDTYKPSSSYNFGVGAFLLAGAEMDALSQHKHW